MNGKAAFSLRKKAKVALMPLHGNLFLRLLFCACAVNIMIDYKAARADFSASVLQCLLNDLLFVKPKYTQKPGFQ